MENLAKLREADGKEDFGSREQELVKEEPQKKKKLVVFEIDNFNNAPTVYQVSSFRIEGLTLRTPSHRESITTAKTCQSPVVSGNVSAMMFDEFGIDLVELQNRVLELEKQLKNDNLELPPIFSDLKYQVENFRNKLEIAERSRKTGFEKEGFCQRFQYRRTSSERGRKIREKFLSICEKDISESTKDWLKQPSFDSSQYEDEEILLFLQFMFIELGLITRFDIRLPILRNFLYEVYKNYNEVPFHNFRHCFCVAQMMYVMIWSVDIQKKMGDLETLILLTSCICHDLDHPGYNNIYQINARTELALLYNDISPLENHHCSVAFRILENPECNIFESLDKETFKEVREGIIRCILATDMARHNEILTQFKDIIPEFDFGNKAHKNLLSMILIKVADISNEARPMNVAEPWLDRLLMEFFKQSDAEKKEGLPVTPFMDREKITKPSSQCSFIGFVLLPLFEALGELLPELDDLIISPARYALDHYRRLNEAAKDERLRRKSVVESTNLENEVLEGSGMIKSGSGLSVRSKRSLSIQGRQRSKSTEEFDADATPPSSPGALSGYLEDLEDLDEREEIEEEEKNEDEEVPDEEETVTEVEVSEKTLKFKISTEGSAVNFPGRRSCPGNCSGSRKGSRERSHYLENEMDWSRFEKDEDGRSLKRSATSETMGSRKGSSDSEKLPLEKASPKESREAEMGDDGRRPSRQKEHRPKGLYEKKKYDYRRKSLAVMERTREWDHSKRRKSTSNTQESNLGKPSAGRKETEPKSAVKKIGSSVLDKLESPVSENRCSREFETSCWGLQNLKKDTRVFNKSPVVINKTLKNSLEKNADSEKSKSEDNLTIKSSDKAGNNINVSKTDESIEKQLAGDPEKKKKLGSTGHLSLLSRLKHLKGRMSSSREEVASNGDKTGTGDNQNSSKVCDCERSRTLPKTKKPNRTSGKMKKGWRALIGRSEGNSSSSLEVLPPTASPSPVHSTRNSSVEEEDKKRSWLSSPKKSGFLSKMGRGEEDNARQNFFNNLATSFRKKGGGRSDEESAPTCTSFAQDGSKPN